MTCPWSIRSPGERRRSCRSLSVSSSWARRSSPSAGSEWPCSCSGSSPCSGRGPSSAEAGRCPATVREAALFALLTGVTIASYSAVDTQGARLIDPLFYAALLWTFTTIFLLAGSAWRSGATAAGRPPKPSPARPALVRPATRLSRRLVRPSLVPGRSRWPDHRRGVPVRADRLPLCAPHGSRTLARVGHRDHQRLGRVPPQGGAATGARG